MHAADRNPKDLPTPEVEPFALSSFRWKMAESLLISNALLMASQQTRRGDLPLPFQKKSPSKASALESRGSSLSLASLELPLLGKILYIAIFAKAV